MIVDRSDPRSLFDFFLAIVTPTASRHAKLLFQMPPAIWKAELATKQAG
jgi:uncharacterized protein YecE (DUF72 family)